MLLLLLLPLLQGMLTTTKITNSFNNKEEKRQSLDFFGKDIPNQGFMPESSLRQVSHYSLCRLPAFFPKND